MDLYQIRYFLTIVETGSFTKAAERLYVSQPSLSTGIKKLEQELGVILLERGGRRTVLTAAGHFFLGRAEAILQEYDAALQGLRGYEDQPTIRLGTTRTIRIMNLARIMAAFREKHPQVTIELREGSPEDLQTSLDQGELDLIVTGTSGNQPPAGSQLLFHQSLMLAVPSDHPFTTCESISLARLDNQPYIERIHCEIWRAYPQLFTSAGIQPHIIYRADHEEWVLSLITEGMGVSIMPVWKNLQNIIYIPFSDQSLCRSVGMRWRQQQHSEIVAKFRDFLFSSEWT